MPIIRTEHKTSWLQDLLPVAYLVLVESIVCYHQHPGISLCWIIDSYPIFSITVGEYSFLFIAYFHFRLTLRDCMAKLLD